MRLEIFIGKFGSLSNNHREQSGYMRTLVSSTCSRDSHCSRHREHIKEKTIFDNKGPKIRFEEHN